VFFSERKHRFSLAEFNLHATSVTFKLLGAVHILDAIVHTLVDSIHLVAGGLSHTLAKFNIQICYDQTGSTAST